MDNRNKKKVIGLLVSGITDPFSVSLIRGVSQAARSVNVDVLVFPGKYFDRDLSQLPEITYEYQYTTIYTSARHAKLDGLIISANSISCHTTKERMKEFVDAYQGVPRVLVATRMEGHTCISYDNATPVREGLEYLIHKEGCRHICLLGGPAGNTDVIDRREAYEETLKKCGLACYPRMYEEGNFEVSQVSELAMERLLKANPEMDAVFCLNDYMAISAYEVLKRHRLQPGEDIKILGFDNVAESSAMDPPLATVAADPIVLGERSLQCLLKIIEGERLDSMTLSARLIRRKSIGWNYARETSGDLVGGDSLQEDFQKIYYRYIYEHDAQANQKAYEQFASAVEGILQYADRSCVSFQKPEEVMKEFEEFVRSEVLTYMDTEAMLRLVDRISARSASFIRTAGNLYSHADMPVIIPEIYRCLAQVEVLRAGTVGRRIHAADNAKNTFVKRTMSFQHGNDFSYQNLLGYLNWAGITEGYLYIYDDPIVHREKEPFFPPAEAQLKAVLENGEVRTPPVGQQRKSLAEFRTLTEDIPGSRCMMVAPVYYSEELYGLFLCNVSELLFFEGEFIINQIGTAVRMLQLLAENEGIQQTLEEHLTVINQMNTELSTLSRSDVLTGLLNRRGLMDSAEAFLKEQQAASRDTLVGYMDMNDLKVVNDRFGHEEGDFSLKTIARILKETLDPDSSILSRIGGDEYVFLASGDQGTGKQLEEKLHAAFAAFNETSDKPYNITVSVGFCRVAGGSDTKLEDAISYADQELYIAKQYKNRNILKN